MPEAEIIEKIGSRCDAVIGQLTEEWGDTLFEALKTAGGKVYSNYAVGFNNVQVHCHLSPIRLIVRLSISLDSWDC